jgi:hypothetical protein
LVPVREALDEAIDAIEERVQSLLSPWVNAFDEIDLGLDDEDLLD